LGAGAGHVAPLIADDAAGIPTRPVVVRARRGLRIVVVARQIGGGSGSRRGCGRQHGHRQNLLFHFTLHLLTHSAIRGKASLSLALGCQTWTIFRGRVIALWRLSGYYPLTLTPCYP